VNGIARQTSFDCKKGLAPQSDRVVDQMPVLLTQITKFLFRQSRRKQSAFRRLTITLQTDRRMVGFVPEPLHMSRILFVTGLNQAVARDDPFELRSLGNGENFAQCVENLYPVRHAPDAISVRD
jgi:hypothetical protein